MASPIELATEDKLEYNFFPNNSGFQQFRIRAANDAHIALTIGAAESEPIYEIFIGGWKNEKSVIRKDRTRPDVAEADTPGILSSDEFRGFWIRWGKGNISAGKEGESDPFLSYDEPSGFNGGYVGFCTGWGANGTWLIEQAGQGSANSSVACWVAAEGGNIPPSAFVGGEDNNEPLYVIRANFNGALIPGKLVCSHGVCYVPWGGAENGVPEYEVLCDFGGRWQAGTGSDIPSNALTAGQSEDGEPLYVGRVVHEGCLTVGKVQPSHGVCYIPFGGQEMSFGEFEILVS